MDVKTFREPNIDSDYFIVGVRIKSRISTQKLYKSNNEKKINIDRLKNDELKNHYEEKLSIVILKMKDTANQTQIENITLECTV